ncbi:MAG TPA: phage terminase large subunit [Candidatus Acidoferrales bacterium]|nr:phage terminase large subunit [Candidatus Acidoferrales bacterium]
MPPSEFQQWFEACVDAQRLKAASSTASAENIGDETQRVELPLPYKPFAKQDEFHKCQAKYKLFGGAAGPGKSKALLMEAILQATEFPNVNTLLLRRTFPELEGSLLLYFRRDVPRELYRSFNEAKHTVTWHNGSTTRFGYSQSENDIYQYQSGEYLFIGVDELTHFTLRQWQFLTSRNRCPVADAFPNMAGATNPGNIGHAWVKALFVDKQPAAGMDPREYDAADYAFIAARVWDNPIYANDASYLKTLEKLPDSYRHAFLDGDWSVFAGQYFTNFDPSRNVIRAESIAAEAWWPRWISIDWGFEHPAAIYWHTNAPAVESPQRRLDNSHTHGHGCDLPAQNVEIPRAGVVGFANGDGDWRRKTRVITYRECVEQHLAPRALAAEIVARSHDRDGKAEHIDAIYLSPDAFAHHTDESSIAERLSDALAAAGFPRPVPADNDRVSGWMLMYEMLEADEWQIADSCPELIRTLPELVRDTANVEDIAKREGDDAADAARYGLKTRASGKMPKPPREQEIHARVTSDDPTIRAIQARKAEHDLRGSASPIVSRRHAPANMRRRWLW